MSANWELSWAEPLAQLLDRTIRPLARLSDGLGEIAGNRLCIGLRLLG